MKGLVMKYYLVLLFFCGMAGWMFGMGSPGRLTGEKPLMAGDEYQGVELGRAGFSTNRVIDNAVAVYESKTVNRPDIGMLGYNHNWLWNNAHMSRVVHGEPVPDPAYVKLLEHLRFPLNRVSGTQSQRIRWKESIGPYAERSPQQLVDWTGPEALKTGPIEWIKMLRLLDPDARTVWVVNMMQDTAQDNADLLEFLTGDGTTNPNGGVNWAQRRIEQGVIEPVRPLLIEVGSEMDWGKERAHYPVERYIDECRKRMDAMRAVWPEVSFAVHAATAPWSKKHAEIGGWRNWHLAVLKKLADQIDFVAIHPYYHGMAVSRIEQKYMKVLMKDIRDVTGSDRIKIFVSEHARWPRTLAKENRYQTHSLEGALAVGEWINRMLQYPQIKYMAYHSLSGGPWGLVYKGDEGFYLTAMADFFEVYGNAFGDEVVDVRVQGPGADVEHSDLMFTVNAMRSGNTLRLIAVNREADAQRAVTFTFEQGYRLVKKTVLTGPHLDAVNNETRQDVRVTTTLSDEPEAFTSCVIGARSLTVLYLEPLK